MSLLIVVLTSGVSIMRSDVSPPGANSALLAFHYEQIPHNEAHTLTSVAPLDRAHRDISIDCKNFFCHIFGRSGDVSAAKTAF